jgi:hypothetical protein
MKKTILFCLLVGGLLFFSQKTFGQNQTPNPTKFDNFIAQVYTGQGVSQITPNTRRYTFMKEAFLKRISYSKIDPVKSKLGSYKKLSQVPLFDTYNKGLFRDGSFNADTFNPFKYMFDFYSNQTQIIQVDNANVLIIIKPHNYNASK